MSSKMAFGSLKNCILVRGERYENGNTTTTDISDYIQCSMKSKSRSANNTSITEIMS